MNFFYNSATIDCAACHSNHYSGILSIIPINCDTHKKTVICSLHHPHHSALSLGARVQFALSRARDCATLDSNSWDRMRSIVQH